MCYYRASPGAGGILQGSRVLCGGEALERLVVFSSMRELMVWLSEGLGEGTGQVQGE